MSAVASPGIPRTIVEPGNGTGTISIELPPGVTIDLEAVLANIDATGAGGPVTATLAVSEQSGVVIATKRQGETVDAGIAGTATWALRLDDDGGGGATPTTTLYEAFEDATGVVCPTTPTITVLPFVHSFGAVLGGFLAGKYTIAAAGTYALALWVNCQTQPAPYTVIANIRVAAAPTFQAVSLTAPIVTGLPLSGGGPAWSLTRPFAAGAQLDVRVSHNAAGNRVMFLSGGLAKIG